MVVTCSCDLEEIDGQQTLVLIVASTGDRVNIPITPEKESELRDAGLLDADDFPDED